MIRYLEVRVAAGIERGRHALKMLQGDLGAPDPEAERIRQSHSRAQRALAAVER